MVILVSGASGFIGSAITRHLLAAGHEVRAMGRSPERARARLGRWPEGRQAMEEKRLSFVSADVTKPETLIPAVKDVDLIIQAAQFPNAPVEDAARGYTYAKIDRDGTINLLNAIAHVYQAQTAGPGLTRFPDGAPRFIYISGVTVSPEATAFWDRAKWQAEEAVRSSGLDWTIVRNSPTYGPDDVSFNRILGYSAFLPVLGLFGDGEEKLTPVYIEDVGRFVTRLVEDPDAARDTTFPFGGPEVMTTNQMMRTALDVLHRRRPLLHVPKSAGRLVGRGIQLVPRAVLPKKPLSAGAVDFTAQGGVADLTLVRERFPDLELTPLREALETYLPGR